MPLIFRTIDLALRNLSRRLRAQRFFFERTFIDHTRIFVRSTLMVRLFYAVALINGMANAQWMIDHFQTSEFSNPLWLFRGFLHQHLSMLGQVGVYFVLVGSFVAAWERSPRWARVLHALGVLITVGLQNSEGTTGHSKHMYVWASMGLALLSTFKPQLGVAARRAHHSHLQIVWATQFLLVFFYFISACWKLVGLFNCTFFMSQICAVDHNIFANFLANQLIKHNQFTPYKNLVFSAPWLGVCLYVAAIYGQLTAVIVVFRYDLHVLLGMMVIVFHLSTFLFLGVNFSSGLPCVAVLFLISPFGGGGIPLWRQAGRLPGAYLLFGRRL